MLGCASPKASGLFYLLLRTPLSPPVMTTNVSGCEVLIMDSFLTFHGSRKYSSMVELVNWHHTDTSDLPSSYPADLWSYNYYTGELVPPTHLIDPHLMTQQALSLLKEWEQSSKPLFLIIIADRQIVYVEIHYMTDWGDGNKWFSIYFQVCQYPVFECPGHLAPGVITVSVGFHRS